MNTQLHLNRWPQVIARCIVILLILGCGTKAQEHFDCSDFPKPLGFVSDFEQVFDSTEITSLSSLLQAYETTSTNEIAVASVSSIQPASSMFEYSLHMARCWGVGKKDKNNGVLIVFSKTLKQIHIQNGTGIVNQLTDKETKHIIDEVIIPQIKKGLYYEGIRDGIVAIQKELE